MKRILITIISCFCLFVSTVFAADYFTEGKAAFNQKDYRQANLLFVKALTANPNDATCRYYYAQTLTYIQNYKQARKEYGYVIQLAPNSLAAKYSKQAIANIDSAYPELNPNNPVNNQPSVTANDNYIQKAITTTGDLVTWDLDKMPLKVYINNNYRVSSAYVEAAKSALSTWQGASDGLVSFIYVNEPQFADVTIVMQGVAQKTDNQILGLTKHTSKNGYIDKVTVTLYTIGVNYKNLTPTDVYNVALHEFGHMLGMWGHSDNQSDVMYALYNPSSKAQRNTLSVRDKNTIKALMEIDKNPYATSVNSINKVLGSKEDRMNSKLNQGLSYINQVPGNPIGYITVANTYKAMDKEYEAISYYKKALSIDPSNKEASGALGNIYFKRDDLPNAEIYYKNLIKVDGKNPHAYCNLINLYIRHKRLSNANALLNSLLYRNPAAKQEKCIQQIMKTLGR